MPGDKVLVIDDDLEILELINAILSKAGYDVKACDDPVAGLEFLAQETPAVVLTDVVMPQLNGFDVLRRVVELGRVTQVVLMTGYVDPARVLDAYQLGASDYFHKPICDEREVLDAVARADMRYHRWHDVVTEGIHQWHGGAELGPRPSSPIPLEGIDLDQLYTRDELAEKRKGFLTRMLGLFQVLQDPIELARTVGHKVAGTGGNLGLGTLVRPGRELEEHARRCDDEVPARLRSMHDSLCEELARLERGAAA